ncbi:MULTISPECIES: BPSS1780 family membrane protein [Silvimonas]|uniref:BPSS1780 family membrane protein n=1 Tax=Silvimonas TaxID=300264 RepID=UPI0024B3A52B|nr:MULTISPECIES: BPSS1780 family membrane protein [Silvimonas]MDR3429801.1 BPSS1780 family membrane protein [Silvimonas sp.]
MDYTGIIIDNSVEPKRVPASHGWLWITDAFRLFFRHWWQWLLLTAITLTILMGVMLIPVLGMITPVIAPVLLAGIAWAANESRVNNRAPAVPDLFNGLKTHARSLLGVGLIYAIGTMIIVMILGGLSALLISPDQIAAIRSAETTHEIPDLGAGSLVFILLFFFGMLVMNSIYFFAPQLVVLRNMRAVEAMRTSYLAFWRNWLPLTVAGLILMVLAVIASLPMMLGLIILLPVSLLFNYCCYADVFSEFSDIPPHP